MHRLAYNTGIATSIPRYQPRFISISNKKRGSAVETDRSTASWSYPTPVRDQGGLLPESSKAAEARARAFYGQHEHIVGERGVGHDDEERQSTDFEPSLAEISRANKGFLRSKTETTNCQDEDIDQTGQTKTVTNYERTVKDAMKRLLEIHSRRPTSDNLPKPDTKSSKPDSHTYQSILPPPSIPPVIKALMDKGQNRLAVFHAISEPHIRSNTPVLLHLADMLRRRNHGKLAERLSLTVKRMNDQFENRDKMLEDIGLDSTVTSPRYSRYWALPPLPPTPSDTFLAPGRAEKDRLKTTKSSKQHRRIEAEERLTVTLNAQLSSLLRESMLVHHAPQNNSQTGRVSLQDPNFFLHPPRPSLRQLSQLLHHIGRLERKHGFKPDRITANIILRCWLRCAQPIRHTIPFVGYFKDKEQIIRRKRDSPPGRVLSSDDLMIIFRILSKTIESSLESTENRLQDDLKHLDSDQFVKLSQEARWSTERERIMSDQTDHQVKGSFGDVDYHKHVKPFTEMLIGSLRRVAGFHETEQVIDWKQAMQRRLLAVKQAKEVLVLLESRKGEEQVDSSRSVSTDDVVRSDKKK